MGDHFVSCALQCGVETGRIDIIAAMGRLGQELAHGEIDQIDNARHHRLSEEAYFEVIRRKTASLFRVCMHVGAISVNADDAVCKDLERFGELLGLCFQIKDDILDFEISQVSGKKYGNDIKECKFTLPILDYIDTLSEEVKLNVINFVKQKDKSDEDVLKLVLDIAKSGSIEKTEEQVKYYSNKAKEVLSNLPESQYREILEQLVEILVKRNN
jgi:octaprenyl-diphosphate synthase